MSYMNLFFLGKKYREAVLFLQVFLMVTVACIAAAPFENTFNEYMIVKKSVSENLNDRLLTFLPGLTLTESFYTPEIDTVYSGTLEKSTEKYIGKDLVRKVTENIRKEECVENIYQSYTGNAVFDENSDDSSQFNSTVIVLPENVLSDFSYNLPYEISSGIYISSNLGKLYARGDSLSLKWIDGNNVNIEYTVKDVLPENYSFLNIGGSNNPYYSISETENLIIITSIDEISDLLYFEPFFLLSVKEGTTEDEIMSLNSVYSDYGKFVYTKDYLSDCLNDTVRQDKWNILIVFLALDVTIVGFVGYSIFRLINKSTVFKVLYVCGMHRKKILFINACSVLIVVIPAFISAVLAAPYIVNFIGFSDYTGFSDVFILFVVALCIILGSVCLLISSKLLDVKIRTIQSDS